MNAARCSGSERSDAERGSSERCGSKRSARVPAGHPRGASSFAALSTDTQRFNRARLCFL